MTCVYQLTSNTTELGGWGTSGGPLIAQSFTANCSGSLSQIDLQISDNNGSPSDDVIVGLYQGNPAGSFTHLASSSISGGPYSACAGGGSTASALFNQDVISGQTYTVLYSRTGSLGDPSYVTCGLAGGGYGGGTGWTFDGSSWSTSAHDYNLKFTIASSSATSSNPVASDSQLMRGETIMSVALAIFLAMIVYFFVKLFVPKKRQR